MRWTPRRRFVLTVLYHSREGLSTIDVVKHVGFYPLFVLNRLEQTGLVSSRREPGGIDRDHKPKRIWSITSDGARTLDELRSKL